MGAAKAARGLRLKLIAVVVWLVATLSLSGWWLIYGLQQVEIMGQGTVAQTAAEITRRHRMLLSEGFALFILLLVGGLSLLYTLSVELKRSRQIREFFAAFTHDLKTSLASLRLQAETLEEDLKDSPSQERVVRRLVKDTIRLELQLDNSLFIADTEMGHLHIEKVSVNETIRALRHYWPELKIEQSIDCSVMADTRALESIFKNLLQNAVVHGKASHVIVRCENLEGGVKTLIELSDNGGGFKGDAKNLGQMFVRHTTKSGSGIGLHLVKKLIQRMDGEFRVISGDTSNEQGFRVAITLPGGPLR